MWEWQHDAQCIDRAGRAVEPRAADKRIPNVDRDRAERLLAPFAGADEVEPLSRHFAADRHDRIIAVPVQPVDRQSNEGPAARLSRLDREPRRLSVRRSSLGDGGAGECEEQGKSVMGSVPGHGIKLPSCNRTTATRHRWPGTKDRWI